MLTHKFDDRQTAALCSGVYMRVFDDAFLTSQNELRIDFRRD